jgi:hypothetical protein
MEEVMLKKIIIISLLFYASIVISPNLSTSTYPQRLPLVTQSFDYKLDSLMYTDGVFDIKISDVRLTYYYVNDNTGSGQCTSSGLCIKDFKVNKYGWYTYKDKIVIATATYRCLNVKSGPCGKFNEIPEDFNIYNLHEVLTININGNFYEAIVLDSCGACMFKVNGENTQRYDIFMVSPNHHLFKKPPTFASIIQITRTQN